MVTNILTETCLAAIHGNYSFNRWLLHEYFIWKRYHRDYHTSTPIDFCREKEIDVNNFFDWTGYRRNKPDDLETIEKFWNHFGFCYCIVSKTPPPPTAFEGIRPTPQENQTAFYKLLSILKKNNELYGFPEIDKLYLSLIIKTRKEGNV